MVDKHSLYVKTYAYNSFKVLAIDGYSNSSVSQFEACLGHFLDTGY